MANVSVYNIEGKEVGKIDLRDSSKMSCNPKCRCGSAMLLVFSVLL